jgi:hypothetical protein
VQLNDERIKSEGIRRTLEAFDLRRSADFSSRVDLEILAGLGFHLRFFWFCAGNHLVFDEK